MHQFKPFHKRNQSLQNTASDFPLNIKPIKTPLLVTKNQFNHTNFSFFAIADSPLSKNINEYLNEKMNLANEDKQTNKSKQIFMPTSLNTNFKVKVRKTRGKNWKNQTERANLPNQYHTISHSFHNPAQSDAINKNISNNEIKQKIPISIGAFKQTSLQKTAELLTKNCESFLSPTLREQIAKRSSKVHTSKSPKQQNIMKKLKIDSLLRRQNPQDERTCVTPNNFFISRKTLGERGSGSPISKLMNTTANFDRTREQEIIKRFRSTLKQSKREKQRIHIIYANKKVQPLQQPHQPEHKKFIKSNKKQSACDIQPWQAINGRQNEFY